MSGAYYNEIDPFAAQWIRNLIKAGHVAPGEVDERSIKDVTADDLRGFDQVHFFAGVGVWSHALRRAGVPDDYRLFTGSCPCQPFSAAGKQRGFDDERHLWPEFYRLIQECRPPIVFGEQVASKDGDAWIDVVQTDLETLEYRVGAVAFPASGFGAPHIRDRMYWVAHAHDAGFERWQGMPKRTVEFAVGSHGLANGIHGLADTHGGGELRIIGVEESAGERRNQYHDSGAIDGLADAGGERVRTERPGEVAGTARGIGGEAREQRIRPDAGAGGPVECGLAVPVCDGLHRTPGTPPESSGHGQADGLSIGSGQRLRGTNPGPVNGFWGNADWLACRDGKWRPVRPGTQPLVNGATARVGRLRAYGNAICAEAAKGFIEATFEALDTLHL